MKQYSIGDKPWLAFYQWNEIKMTCPACFGQLQIKVILGNGEEMIVPCNSCDQSYMGPTGYITENDFVKKVAQVTISQVESKETLEGKIIESYRFNNNTGYVRPEENKLFDTKEEAENRVEELFEQHELNKIQSIKRKKEDPSKTYGWHIRYHSKKIKELEKDLEYHKKKLIICKETKKRE